MRLRLPLVAFLLLGLVAASCSDDSESGPNPYLNLVGSSRFVSTNRVLSGAGDTLSTRLYTAVADTNSATDQLQRLRITVAYTPGKNPVVYTPTYDPTTYGNNTEELVFLDSLLSTTKPKQQLAFQFTFNARTTSGRELWKFESEDNQQRTASRSYRLTLRNGDSALVYHRYTARLQAPRAISSRSFLALLPGLTLPKFTIRNNPGAQQLVDLIYQPTAAGEPALSSPDSSVLKLRGAKWNVKRTTQLRLASVGDSASFGGANNIAAFTAIFNRGTLPLAPTTTGPLRRRQLIAFLTQDNKYGLIQVENIRTTPVPTLDLQIRIAK
ncbi:hypothetical protein [Hymenobacter metallicola]|uniref:DUF4270 family protein n=1 Tax=Hymenobacter metallicola TaxID=2563114 RepID=A0A4Z0Q8U3_9BACT|nr:hypothetical protein [Hymenobacter metallicola]TGE26507.1 hypothetical protein E5K02_17085 [Hymenobacter metallicola]